MISKEYFLNFHREDNSDNCLEMNEYFRLNDAEAKAIILKSTKCKTITEFQNLPRY